MAHAGKDLPSKACVHVFQHSAACGLHSLACIEVLAIRMLDGICPRSVNALRPALSSDLEGWSQGHAFAGKDLQRALERNQRDREQLEEQLGGAEQKISDLDGKSRDLQQQVHLTPSCHVYLGISLRAALLLAIVDGR